MSSSDAMAIDARLTRLAHLDSSSDDPVVRAEIGRARFLLMEARRGETPVGDRGLRALLERMEHQLVAVRALVGAAVAAREALEAERMLLVEREELRLHKERLRRVSSEVSP